MILSDQAGSYLEVITFSIKSLAYRIPLASSYGGNSVTHKSHHHHAMRSQTLVVSQNPKLLSENTGRDFNLAIENPTPLLPLSQGVLPSSVIPIVS